MRLTLMKSKLHRATVTDSDLEYEGSISIDPKLCDLAGLHLYEKVSIYNCNNGSRFSTYVIHGKDGEICLNGASARHAHRGDKVIIVCYAEFEEHEAVSYQPKQIFLDDNNEPKELKYTDPV